MGWFAINILLPILAPLLLLLVAGKICAPFGPIAYRLRVIRIVKDGQLGWVSVAFSSSAAYEIHAHAQANVLPGWAGPALAGCIALLMLSGTIAVFGATFPVPILKRRKHAFRSWLTHYRLFASSVVILLLAAVLLCTVHIALGAACI